MTLKLVNYINSSGRNLWCLESGFLTTVNDTDVKEVISEFDTFGYSSFIQQPVIGRTILNEYDINPKNNLLAELYETYPELLL